MHIPDGFLSHSINAATFVISSGACAFGVKRVSRSFGEEEVPLMGVTAAFIFAAQMLNFPVAGGTSGHFLGAIFSSVLLGPWASLIIMTIVLVVQCLGFADGGLTAIGSNIFNIGVIGSLGGYCIFITLHTLFQRSRKGFFIAVAISLWLSIVMGASAAAIELAISGTSPLTVALPAMAGIHAIIGIGGSHYYHDSYFPYSEDKARFGYLPTPSRKVKSKRRCLMKRRLDGFILVGLGICLLMALFLTPFTSSSPDGLEKVAETKGFASKGEEWKFWKHAPLPDYEIPWIKNKKVSTTISELVGTLAIFLIALGIGKLVKKPSAKKDLPFILLICLTLPLSSSAYAARPLTTDDTGTVEKGTFQLETGFNFVRQDNHDKEFNPSVTLTYGLFERMDLGVGSGYLFVHPAEGKKKNGFADTELKIKYRVMDEKGWLPSFALTFGKLKIPTGSETKGLGSGETDFGVNFIFTKTLSKRLVLHVNAGYMYIGKHGVNNEFNYSVAGQLIMSDKWALVGEIVGVNNFNGRKGDDPFSGLLGTYYLITDTIIWDGGVEIGMSKAVPDFRLTTGLTILLKP